MGLKNFIKKTAIAGVLGASLLFGRGAKAQDDLESKCNEPSAIINFENPLDDFEANSNLWFSASQLVRKTSDNLESDSKNEKLLGRFGRSVGNFYFSAMFQHYAHEISHNFIDRRYGERHGFNVSFTDWSTSWVLPIPEYIQHPLHLWQTVFTEEEVFNSGCFGLNTDEYSSKKYWRDIVLNKKSHALDNIPYLVTKLFDISYILNLGLEDKRGPTGLAMPEFVEYVVDVNGSTGVNDIDFYTLYLYNKGIDLKKKEYLLQMLFSDLLSWQTYEGFSSIFHYIKDGKQENKPLTFKFLGMEVTPPIMNLYLTSQGSFLDTTYILNPKRKYPLEVSLGIDGNIIGESDLNCLRLGLQAYNLKLKNVKFNPFLYLDTTKLLDYKGVSLGTDLSWYFSQKFGLRGRIEYNEDDVINNRIKCEGNGLKFTGGLEARF